MKKSVFKSHPSKGFSFVEILVTTLVLGVGMVGAAKFQADIIKTSTRSQQQMEAINFAKATMEKKLYFSTSTQFQSILDSAAGEDSMTGDNATYTAQWTIEESDNSRGANIKLKVSWGTDESIYLTTIVSNTTPSAMTLTPMAPSRDPVLDPINVAVNFPSVDPSNPENSENICRCNGSSAVAFNSTPSRLMNKSNFVRVSSSDGDDDGGGMMGDWYGRDRDGDGSDDDESKSVETVVTGASTECNLCCNAANAAAKADFKDQVEKYYAQLEAMFMKKVRFGGDQVIDENYFNPRYLSKGYKNINNDLHKYLIDASSSSDDDGDQDWSSDDGSDDSDTSTYTFTASCGIDYDPAPAPTISVPAPQPVAKAVRCVYFRNN